MAATDTSDKYRFGVHPSYTEHLPDWVAMEDAYEGEERVKSKNDTYLPYTAAQRLDGMGAGQPGLADYEAYKKRAVFPDYVTDAVETLVGMMHAKPGKIVVPPGMETIVAACTKDGMSAAGLLKVINELQLCPGRCGLLVDIDAATRLPYIALYYANDIVNWYEENCVCNYVVLDETSIVLDKQTGVWKTAARHRICDASSGQYKSAVFEEGESFSEDKFVTITLNGNSVNELAFVFVNARTVSPECDRAPLLGLARACYAIYRLEADYRQNLHMQGQDTLVVSDASTGEEAAPTRVGAGAKINVNIGGDAKYIGVDSRGLPEQRMAIQNDRESAQRRAGHFIASGKASQESGDALRTRLAALTATLNTVSQTGAEALEKALKFCAQFMGKDPNEVKVEPNTEYFDIQLLGQDLELYMRAISEGAPLSPESVHDMLKKRGVAKFDYATEVQKRDEQYTPIAPKTTTVPPVVTPPTA